MTGSCRSFHAIGHTLATLVTNDVTLDGMGFPGRSIVRFRRTSPVSSGFPISLHQCAYLSVFAGVLLVLIYSTYPETTSWDTILARSSRIEVIPWWTVALDEKDGKAEIEQTYVNYLLCAFHGGFSL